MDFIKLKPSSTFFAVLEELHSCPGAPKRIANYFAQRKQTTSGLKSRNSSSNHEGDGELQSEESSLADKMVTEENSSFDLLLLTSDIKWCHNKMRERGMPHRIHELINYSKIILPAYEPPPRNPELEARIQKLRNEQSNREYREMTKNITHTRGKPADVSTIGSELREMHREINRQIITGVQYIVSIVGTFFALYVGLGFATTEFGPRIVIALIAALIVGVAEIYFIIREDIRVENHKLKNK